MKLKYFNKEFQKEYWEDNKNARPEPVKNFV
jgi:hypothetical protein